MTKHKILIIGATVRLRKKVEVMLSNFAGMTIASRANISGIGTYFVKYRTDVVLLECSADVRENIEEIHANKPTIPVVVYGDDIDYALTRDAFLSGAIDVLKIRGGGRP